LPSCQCDNLQLSRLGSASEEHNRSQALGATARRGIHGFRRSCHMQCFVRHAACRMPQAACHMRACNIPHSTRHVQRATLHGMRVVRCLNGAIVFRAARYPMRHDIPVDSRRICVALPPFVAILDSPRLFLARLASVLSTMLYSAWFWARSHPPARSVAIGDGAARHIRSLLQVG
jgi:hypothetical protein